MVEKMDGENALQAIDCLRQVIVEWFGSRDKAVELALATMDKRLDAMNEFRAALRDQTGLLMPRTEWNAIQATIVRDLEILRIETVKVARDQIHAEKTSALERGQLENRLHTMNEFRGALTDQVGTFLPRLEGDARYTALNADIRRLELAATDSATHKDLNDTENLLDFRVKSLETKQANWEGRTAIFGVLFVAFNIFLTWFLSGVHLVAR